MSTRDRDLDTFSHLTYHRVLSYADTIKDYNDGMDDLASVLTELIEGSQINKLQTSNNSRDKGYLRNNGNSQDCEVVYNKPEIDQEFNTQVAIGRIIEMDETGFSMRTTAFGIVSVPLEDERGDLSVGDKVKVSVAGDEVSIDLLQKKISIDR